MLRTRPMSTRVCKHSVKAHDTLLMWLLLAITLILSALPALLVFSCLTQARTDSMTVNLAVEALQQLRMLWLMTALLHAHTRRPTW